jgi:hypothetical protein
MKNNYLKIKKHEKFILYIFVAAFNSNAQINADDVQ